MILLMLYGKITYFNSHPHEEDDVTCGSRTIWFNISTHILTRRMTLAGGDPPKIDDISTHILTRRMTCNSCHRFTRERYFNSHPHEEDDEVCRIARDDSDISTHILTRRMTAILNKNKLFKITYYINNKQFISIVDIFFHFHIYF